MNALFTWVGTYIWVLQGLLWDNRPEYSKKKIKKFEVSLVCASQKNEQMPYLSNSLVKWNKYCFLFTQKSNCSFFLQKKLKVLWSDASEIMEMEEV